MALTDTPSKTRTITLSDEVYDGIIAVLQGNKKIVGRMQTLLLNKELLEIRVIIIIYLVGMNNY